MLDTYSQLGDLEIGKGGTIRAIDRLDLIMAMHFQMLLLPASSYPIEAAPGGTRKPHFRWSEKSKQIAAHVSRMDPLNTKCASMLTNGYSRQTPGVCLH